MSARPTQAQREQFTHFHRIGTRWMDNDMYGHVNNVVYYSYFDTADSAKAVAQGHFVHVYVDQRLRRPVAELPKTLAVALTRLTR